MHFFVAVVMVSFVTIALAQDIRRVDYFGIKRGSQIAGSCIANAQVGVYSSIVKCTMTASGKITDDYVRLGFEFHNFVVDARSEEILRNDPKIPLPAKRSLADLVKSDFKVLRFFQRKLFLSTRDLCVITELNCELAERMERYWLLSEG